MEEFKRIEAEISILEKSADSLEWQKKKTNLDEFKGILLVLYKTKDEYIGKQAMLQQQRFNLEFAQKGVEGLKIEEVALNERVEALVALKEAFSPRGIKAVAVDYIIPNLEERINSILEQMSDFRIRLDTQQAKTSEEGVKEGLFITVINEVGEEMNFDSFSGGERVKITIAISEALASLLSGRIGFRIMDENIISLDKESTEVFVSVLTKLQEKFNQLLIISHLDAVKDIFEKKIMVTKINGVSKII